MVDLVFNSLLNHTFNRVGPRRLPDGQGGWAIEFIALDAILGRLRPATSRERALALQEERVITHVFYCNVDTDLVRGDLLSPGAIAIDGFTLTASDILVKVEGLREPSTNDHHYSVDCIEYQLGAGDVTGYLLLEAGGFRLLEAGGFRLLE